MEKEPWSHPLPSSLMTNQYNAHRDYSFGCFCGTIYCTYMNHQPTGRDGRRDGKEARRHHAKEQRHRELVVVIHVFFSIVFGRNR
jgi:hypothetical protein